ncbi:MAG TPA: ribosome maturation factor RimP [Methylomirabilota bacterium]|jgi:ribosome maturation factor RimP|nr:ribosome maturation factor RimP [Methylomirabilota bacterium]
MEEAARTGLIEEAVAPVVADHGLQLVDVEWRELRPRGLLRLYVDKLGGVGIGDCERLSREIGDVLDAAAVIEGGYDLEVSSPGLDRQLRKEREYRWAIGRQVRCWLAGGAEVRGRLTAVTADRLVLDRGGEQVELGRADVTKARLEAEVPWPRKA